MNKKLWGGRFSESTHPDIEAYTASIQFDQTLIYDDIMGSLIHAMMLEKCNIISVNESQLLQQGLQAIAKKVSAGEVAFDPADEDVHMNVERLLHEEIGAVAGKLHTARSRNDQVTLDLHLYLRRQTAVTINLLAQVQQELIYLAQQHRNIILPGYTHMQRAQPIVLAQHWLAYASMLERDIARLKDNYKRLNICPLGAGALSGSSFAIDKKYVAEQLGFDDIYLNTMDAVSDRDFVIEFLAASSLLMMHLSRLSEEMILWSSQEFNFIELDDAYCTGSSMMPQKKNPDIAELARGKTGRVYGSLIAVLTLLKGLPLTYNRDLQEDKEPLFDTMKTVQMTLTVYAGLLQHIKVNTGIMQAATAKGFLNATALAEYLVKKGVVFRVAHEVVGNMVAHCTQNDCLLEALTVSQMQQFSSVFADDVYDAIKIDKIVVNNDINAQGQSQIDIELAVRQQQAEQTLNWLSKQYELFEKINKLHE